MAAATGQFWPLRWPPAASANPLGSVKSPTITTGTLANGANETGYASLGRSISLLRVTASAACRLRLYSTAAARDNDASRAIGTDPTGEHGCIYDANLIVGNLTLDCSPQPFGSNLDTPRTDRIYYNIQNKSGGSAAITVTLLRKIEEAS